MHSTLFPGLIGGLILAVFSHQPPPVPLAQVPDVAYSPQQLDCARFQETISSNILTEAGGRIRRQTAERRGAWQFRATGAGDAIAVEGWLDSLSLVRRSPEAAITPDTDGLIGGRYRGSLSRSGAYSSKVRPFIPDEIAEIADMGGALDDFFPPLPQRSLRVGQQWTDSLGLTIRRLPDSALSGVLLSRFALESRKELKAAPTPADTVPLKVRQSSQERGEFVWHPLLGLLRRDRQIVVETTVPPSRSVRQAVRSRLEQHIRVARDLVPPVGCGPDPA